MPCAANGGPKLHKQGGPAFANSVCPERHGRAEVSASAMLLVCAPGRLTRCCLLQTAPGADSGGALSQGPSQEQ